MLIRRIAKDALGEDYPETPARSQELDTTFKEEQLWRLFIVERVRVLECAGFLVSLPLVAQVVL